MIDMLGAFLQMGSTLGGSILSERRAREIYDKEKAEKRKHTRSILLKETGDLSEDLRNQYLSTGLDPSSLNSKISGMYKNIDNILNQTYGFEPPAGRKRRKFLGIF